MKNRKFGRKADNRDHLLRNLAAALILHEKVETTEPKAKSVARIVERAITKAKTASLSSRRAFLATYFDTAISRKLIEVIGPRYINRSGGYTSVLRLTPRAGDGAKRALVSLVNDTSQSSKAPTVTEESENGQTE